MRRTVGIVLALSLASGDAAADGIFLNAKGQAESARLEALVRPAKIERAGARVFIRGRIVDAHAQPRGYVVQFQPGWLAGGRHVWARDAVTLESDVIQMLGIEVDSHLDLQLMLSSRDDANPGAPAAQRTRAPIGSPAWHARLARILRPDDPTEPAAETASLTHRGWVMFSLIEEPTPVLPTDPAGQAAHRRYLEAARARFVARIKAGGADILHASARTATGGHAMRSLVFGAARARRYGWDDRDDPTFDRAALQQPRGPGEGKDLSERILIAAAFMCRLAETPHTGPRQRCPAGQPCVAEPLLMPTGQRIADFGLDARTHALSILDDAVPGVPDTAAMYEPAAPPVEPAEAALMALGVLERCRPIWDRDAARVVRTLIKHAGEPPAGATAAQRTLRTEARRMLLASLRPDLSAVAGPELARRRADATEMRRTLSALIVTQDPTERAVARSIVLDGGKVNDVIHDELIDWLFSVALDPYAPEGGSGAQPRRATRRDAITMMMVLGTLADPARPDKPGTHPAARRILERVRGIRAAKAAGTVGPGGASFLKLLDARAGEVDGELGRHLERFVGLSGS